MFELNEEEWIFLRSQFVNLKTERGQHSKYMSLAFTEQEGATRTKKDWLYQ
jgi:hypothetical protein